MCKETIKSSSQGVEKNTNSSYATDLDLHSGKNLQKKSMNILRVFVSIGLIIYLVVSIVFCFYVICFSEISKSLVIIFLIIVAVYIYLGINMRSIFRLLSGMDIKKRSTQMHVDVRKGKHSVNPVFDSGGLNVPPQTGSNEPLSAE